MTKHLQKIYAAPLEREFEAWVVAGIERYFKALDLEYAIWAVSPAEEVTWPADERLLFNSKIVGLQFKQAKLVKGDPAPDRLKWALHQPSGQFGLVQHYPQIFYCLPTFINRELREEALQHCIFWRPGNNSNMNVWYDNPQAKTPYKSEKDTMRWGRFVEGMLDCSIGKRIETPQQGIQFLQKVVHDAHEFLNIPKQSSDFLDRRQPDLGLYMVVVKRGS